MTWAYSDESERGATMLLGLTVVPTGQVIEARRALRQLLLPGQRRVHTAKESPARRAQLLDTVAALELRSVVFTLRRPVGVGRVRARSVLVHAAATVVATAGVTTWILDEQEPIQAGRDRHTIDSVIGSLGSPIAYDHRPGHEDPMLWAVDAVVWAAGMRGVSFDRIRQLVREQRVAP